MPREIPKAYDPSVIEPRWAEYWVERRLYVAESNGRKPIFSLVIPPPNVTGSLHMGHMLEHTQIDILIRWKRMLGANVLWLPGTDHAGIATQLVVERQLAEQGIDRLALGRSAFEQKVWEWKEQSGDTIKKQMIRLGASCDWSRERFTLDPGLARAVREVFIRLYEEDLVYRGRYIVNWCPRCRTAISDLETIHQERKDKLYYIRYPVVGSEEFVVVATTRPETMLGDTAVAVHPEDSRYQAILGKHVLLPLMGREIPIITESSIDREFGTGAVKVTPAHDPADFEIGLRHFLPEVNIMDETGRLNEDAGPYAGLDRWDARKRVVQDLYHEGLVERIEDYVHAVGTCQRCHTVVEPRASTQWFVRVKLLAEAAIRAVEENHTRFVPEHWTKVYFDWLRNIHDWCISRQLWWGHRIPAYYCRECGQVMVARETPSACSRCASELIEQDPDVLDTWFSSALWPFSTLGWPERTEDLKRFYPTNLLITGFDILFFWVARMMMMGLKFMEDVPFREVYIHALVRDAERQKMSKTKGNVIDPLEVTEKYGTDAVRFTLAVMAAPGTDIALSEDRMVSYRAFANKIWNAARFILLNLDKSEQAGVVARDDLTADDLVTKAPYPVQGRASLADRWIFARLNHIAGGIEAALEQYRFHEAAHVLYHFFWHEFCDWYIEWVKPQITSLEKSEANRVAWRNLLAAFETALRLLHPFMPFITEELWHQLPQCGPGESISLASYPRLQAEREDAEAEAQVDLLQQIITEIRNVRAELKIEPKRKLAAALGSEDQDVLELVRRQQPMILGLAGLDKLDCHSGHLAPLAETLGPGTIRSAARFDVWVAFDAKDREIERARLAKEKDKTKSELERLARQLNDQTFRAKAPEKVVRSMEARLRQRQIELEKLTTQLARLS
jgi:valyl-tRNA synthetase